MIFAVEATRMAGLLFSLLAFFMLMAWARIYREREEVFRLAEVIVVGHIRPDSVQTYPWVPGEPQEFGAILQVSEVLRGEVSEPELTIVLHHGITPVVGGYLQEGYYTIDSGHRRTGVVEIYDTSSCTVLIVRDAQDNYIWFLRRHTDFYQYSRLHPIPAYASHLGVAEPDEIRPLSEREAILAWLKEKEGNGTA